MITKDEVKGFLQIDVETYDTAISTYIPAVVGYILETTKNQFRQPNFYFESTLISFTATTKKINFLLIDAEGFLVDDWILVENTKYNNFIFQIEEVNTNDIVVVQTVLEEAAENYAKITRLIYDSGIKQIAAEMIGYDLNNSKFVVGVDVVSESLGDASKTYGRVYPERITNKLKAYMRATGR